MPIATIINKSIAGYAHNVLHLDVQIDAPQLVLSVELPVDQATPDGIRSAINAAIAGATQSILVSLPGTIDLAPPAPVQGSVDAGKP